MNRRAGGKIRCSDGNSLKNGVDERFRYLVELGYNLPVKNVKTVSKLADAQTELTVLPSQTEHIQVQLQISAKARQRHFLVLSLLANFL